MQATSAPSGISAPSDVAASRLAALVDSSPHALIALELDGTIVAWNRAAERTFGYRAAEALGRSIQMIGVPGNADIATLINRVASGIVICNHETQRRRKDGSIVDVAVTWAPIADGEENPNGISVIARDLSAMRAAEAEAARVAHQLDMVFNTVGEAIFMMDRENRARFVNDAACEMLGWSREELLGSSMHQLVHYKHPDGRAYPASECPIIRAGRANESAQKLRATFWHRDGRPVPVEVTVQPVQDGEATGSVVVFRDISAQLEAERNASDAADDLRRSEQSFRAAFETSIDPVMIVDDDRRFVAVNPAACELLGVAREQLLTMRADDFLVTGDVDLEWDDFTAAGAYETDARHLRRADGTIIEVEGSARANFLSGRHMAVVRDVTERNREQRKLRASQELLEKTERLTATGSFEHDVDDGELRFSREACRIFGIGTDAGPLGTETVITFIHPDDRAAFYHSMNEAVETGSTALDYRIVRGDDGAVRQVSGRARRESARGEPARLVGTIQDVTERWEADRQLEESEGRYRTLVETANEGVWVVDPEGHTTFANAAMGTMLGTSPAAMRGRNLTEFSPNPDVAAEQFARRQVGLSERLETQLLRVDGERIDVFLSSNPLFDAEENFIGGLAMVVDLTESKRAEREAARLQAELHQIQKMETVGQLAGGIAHDFNNLLAVIINYAEFAAGELDGHPARKDVLEILQAGERAADLTQQLLLFSRKEMAIPEVVDMNDLVRGMDRLIRRTIGEHISLETHAGRRVPKVIVDAGQFEQVLLNLAVNARDAMPDGGKLIVLTSRHRVAEDAPGGLAAGSYARVSVTDTGTGMTGDAIEHAIEPFFTTKPKGAGTGLGLSTVYGIVTAAGGAMGIESRAGAGTTVNIDLPAAPGAAGRESSELPRLADTPTVLVVEDEAAVRKMTSRVLAEAGYRTLEADGGEAAIAIAIGHDGQIDAVLTDVVMPGMSGPALAERLASLRPETPIIFMSGHIERSEKLPVDARLLRKPFRSADLVGEVAAACDREVPR